ncbi:MAG: hypothetical protein OEW72_01720 [Gammaproteobacteria bacterium]|nr:hypothetical protein [Gammaproteobacteria bacterium]
MAILALALASCASTPRAPASSCMQQTVDSLDLASLSAERRHCLASGTIVLRCGSASAWVAGYGKEVGDLFGPGNFQQMDLRANAAGRRCAASAVSEADLPACCADAGF